MPTQPGTIALEIALLGPPTITWAGVTLPIPRRQTRALIYRLVADIWPASRDQLCALFWPDIPDGLARRNLTHLLTHLRRALPDPGLLQADGERVALDQARTASDTAALAEVLADEHASLAALRRAAERLRGPFLAGFSLPGCPEYAAWIDAERARWERIGRDLLTTLTERATAEECYPEAIWAAQRGLELDELDEVLHQRLITLYATVGDRAAVERQYERCVSTLERELEAPPLPATRAAYLAARDRPLPLADRPAHRTLRATPPDELFGRAAEIATVQALLSRPEIRLLTLTGPGGIGKTRLARAVAETLVPTYTEGMVFVPLAPVQEPALLATAIALACGLRDTSDQDARAHLLAVLRERQVLLVLDNLEHLVLAAPLISEILIAAPHVRVLATSREILHLSDEYVFPVPPLTVVDDPIRAPAPAVELFLARAQAVVSGQPLGAGDRADIATICARLDGLPLAIELAAARTRVLTPHALLARLDHRFELLVGGPRDRPARQQTLLATIEWSYNLLGLAERQALRRLAVCAGGFGLALAEQMTVGPGALDTLERLADQSLIQRVPDQGKEPRFTLLESIRAYALERLVEHGELPAVQRAHAQALLALAELAAPELQRHSQAAWLDRLERDQDNLRAALAWALAHDVEIALRLAAALGWFWITRASIGEGRAWLEGALAHGGWPTPGLQVNVPIAQALMSYSTLLFFQGDYVAAASSSTAAAAQLEQLGRMWDATLMWYQLTSVLAIQGDMAGAVAADARSMAVLGARDEPTARALVAMRHGMFAVHSGDDLRARSFLAAACTEIRIIGDLSRLAQMLLQLGTSCLRLGDHDAAQATFIEAQDLARALKDRHLEGLVQNNLGELARVRGDYLAAGEHYQTSLRLLKDTDRRSDIPRLLHNLGFVALHSGETHAALEYFAQSLDLYHAQQLRGTVEVLAGLACVAVTRGKPILAARLWGATTAAWERMAIRAWLPDQIEHNHYLAIARSACDHNAFAAAWAAGATLTLEQALTEACAPGVL